MRNPEFGPTDAVALTVLGAITALAGFWIMQHLRREVLTGSMSGEWIYGHGPDGDETITVTHRYEVTAHPFRCPCDLFHSESEAERAGYVHNGQTKQLDGFGWSGYPFVRVRVPGENRHLPKESCDQQRLG